MYRPLACTVLLAVACGSSDGDAPATPGGGDGPGPASFSALRSLEPLTVNSWRANFTYNDQRQLVRVDVMEPSNIRAGGDFTLNLAYNTFGQLSETFTSREGDEDRPQYRFNYNGDRRLVSIEISTGPDSSRTENISRDGRGRVTGFGDDDRIIYTSDGYLSEFQVSWTGRGSASYSYRDGLLETSGSSPVVRDIEGRYQGFEGREPHEYSAGQLSSTRGYQWTYEPFAMTSFPLAPMVSDLDGFPVAIDFDGLPYDFSSDEAFIGMFVSAAILF